jgi:hypothetical protein
MLNNVYYSVYMLRNYSILIALLLLYICILEIYLLIAKAIQSQPKLSDPFHSYPIPEVCIRTRN